MSHVRQVEQTDQGVGKDEFILHLHLSFDLGEGMAARSLVCLFSSLPSSYPAQLAVCYPYVLTQQAWTESSAIRHTQAVGPSASPVQSFSNPCVTKPCAKITDQSNFPPQRRVEPAVLAPVACA